MSGPAFWDAVEGREAAKLTRTLLSPLAWLYASAGTARHRRAQPESVAAPLICIGNVTMGGAGKTPVARAVLAVLRARGVAAHALSRGYRGRLKGPVQVDPAAHSVHDVGDEPLLLAQDGSAWIARDRVAGARAAVAAGAQAIVMDDGFQNPSLRKDLSILVIDAARPYGNLHVFPAGPLREPVAAGLARADAVVLMLPSLDYAPDMRSLRLEGFEGPVLTAHLAPLGFPPPGPLVAFAGIGRPEKFFDTLRTAGADIVNEAHFPDHHFYSGADLRDLVRLAERHRAALITTEKDHVRLPENMRRQVSAFPVTARFADPVSLEALVTRAIDAHETRGRE